MPEELGTRDVLEQIDARLSNVEQDLRGLRGETRSELGGLRGELNGMRADFNARFEAQTRWLVGLVLASWLTLMASIWLKS